VHYLSALDEGSGKDFGKGTGEDSFRVVICRGRSILDESAIILPCGYGLVDEQNLQYDFSEHFWG
jgi:hypothetical protein